MYILSYSDKLKYEKTMKHIKKFKEKSKND